MVPTPVRQINGFISVWFSGGDLWRYYGDESFSKASWPIRFTAAIGMVIVGATLAVYVDQVKILALIASMASYIWLMFMVPRLADHAPPWIGMVVGTAAVAAIGYAVMFTTFAIWSLSGPLLIIPSIGLFFLISDLTVSLLTFLKCKRLLVRNEEGEFEKGNMFCKKCGRIKLRTLIFGSDIADWVCPKCKR